MVISANENLTWCYSYNIYCKIFQIRTKDQGRCERHHGPPPHDLTQRCCCGWGLHVASLGALASLFCRQSMCWISTRGYRVLKYTPNPYFAKGTLYSSPCLLTGFVFGSNNSHLISHSFGVCKSKTTVSAGLVSSVASPWLADGCLLTVSFLTVFWSDCG